MLVLGRKVNESVVCTLPDGKEVKVTICSLSTHRVKLGFEAPDEIEILREELKNDRVVDTR